jgi:hypothetical protein
MDRDRHPLHIPVAKERIPLVDQYMLPHKDSRDYSSTNCVTHPIYDCNGKIKYSLPLEMYPTANHNHPYVANHNHPHVVALDKRLPSNRYVNHSQRDSRCEGLYE